jgi:phenylacetate-coenzyme A ligase PaaK-like adenylate-forming protein
MMTRVKTTRRWDRMSLDEMRAYQGKKLGHFLRTQVVPFSAHYRRVISEAGCDVSGFKRFEDIEKLPFTTKLDLLPTEDNPNRLKEFILAPSEELIRNALPRNEMLKVALKKVMRGGSRLKKDLLAEYSPATLLFTTGRSTGSIPFFLSLYDLELLKVTGRRICEVFELDPGYDRVVSLFPYAPHLAFWQVAYCGFATGVLVLNTGGGRVMGAERIIGAIEKMKPTCVVGMPGYFYHILRTAYEERRDFSFVKKVALGGENVSWALKVKIREILKDMGSADPKVASVLGFTEARQCWTECPGSESTGFHTSPDLAIFEVIDPKTQKPVPDGTTGELIFTGIDGRGSVVLRYRTGDIVEKGIEHGACPGCGRVVPRIHSNIHRDSNMKSLNISKVKGTLVNLNTLAAVMSADSAIEEWQIVIRKRNDDPFETDEVVLYCALKSGTSAADFGNRISRKVAESTELHLNDVLVTDLRDMLERIGMERNVKEERILDLRDKARAAAPRKIG